jgi:hypothetical protein
VPPATHSQSPGLLSPGVVVTPLPVEPVDAGLKKDLLATAQPEPLPSPVDRAPEVVCNGYVILDGAVTAYLSDGRVAYSDAGEIQQVTKHSLFAFGRVFRVVTGNSLAPEAPRLDMGRSVEMPGVMATPPAPVPAEPAVVRAGVEILPAVNSIASGMQPPQAINGFGSGNMVASRMGLGGNR